MTKKTMMVLYKYCIYSFILAFSLLAFLLCTDSGIITFETHRIPGNIWKYKDTVTFKTDINDNRQWYSFYLNIRNSGLYPFSNLYLFLITTYPDGKKTHDTVESILADDYGKWLGKGLGDIKDNRFLLRRNMKFPLKGTYFFRFVQAMRVDNLKGISDIGIRIEKQVN